MRQGLVRLSQIQQRLSQIGLGRSEGCVKLDCPAEMLERLVLAAQVAERDPQVAVSNHEIRAAARDALEMIDGLGALAQALQGSTQVAQRLGIVGPDRKRGTAAAGGTVEIAESAVRLREVRMVNVRVGLDRHRAADQLDRAGVVALLVMQNAQQVKRLRVSLLARQHPLIQLRGRSQLTRSMHFDCGCQHVLHGKETIPNIPSFAPTDVPRTRRRNRRTAARRMSLYTPVNLS